MCLILKKTAHRSKTKRDSKSQEESFTKVLPKQTLKNKLYNIRRTLNQEGFTQKELGIVMSVVGFHLPVHLLTMCYFNRKKSHTRINPSPSLLKHTYKN